ncbi:Na(+)/H(+) antiporter subunit C [Leucobacter chromiireducens]|uniref:Na(+)/H(+) antiporter subunit C n=1 Tax=Leucobacter chromiireducens subsp. solipictus TaxID=398235 RepID=A0ABS1SAV9_9MICO|nr:Na(+)/H(+) antiporter subunit C [Leucobacter chromiireducens]MBL3677693.1 Na(+)/H(+) antiporter subunit C [Leucobacter chromiireducens subsp. solipictus]
MTMPLVLVAVMVVLYACGVYLMLDRTLTRLLLGFLLVGNATNLLIFLMSGSFGNAPLYGESSAEDMSDPLPQAFVLTAIVITFGVSAFLLALIYRSWRLAAGRDDTVKDGDPDLDFADADELSSDEVTEEGLAGTPDYTDDDDIPDGPDGTEVPLGPTGAGHAVGAAEANPSGHYRVADFTELPSAGEDRR